MLCDRATQTPATLSNSRIDVAPGRAHHADSNLDTRERISVLTVHFLVVLT